MIIIINEGVKRMRDKMSRRIGKFRAIGLVFFSLMILVGWGNTVYSEKPQKTALSANKSAVGPLLVDAKIGYLSSGTLVKGGAWRTVRHTYQDAGYFLRFRYGDDSLVELDEDETLEYRMKVDNGSWSSWQTFPDTPGSNGQTGEIKIDFTDWGSPPPGHYYAHWRVGDIETQVPILITVYPLYAPSYWRFSNSPTRVYKGCAWDPNDDGVADSDTSKEHYTDCDVWAYYAGWRIFTITRTAEGNEVLSAECDSPLNCEEVGLNEFTTITMRYNGPVPISWGGSRAEVGWNWFPSSSFSSQQFPNKMWAFKHQWINDNEEPVSNYVHTPIGGEPPYFIINKSQDITQRYEADETHAIMNRKMFRLKGHYTGGTITSGLLAGPTSDICWRVSYKMIKLDTDHPTYGGWNVLRARYWEYDARWDEETQAWCRWPPGEGYNYDEWIFARDIGLIALNNMGYREGASGYGVPCDESADCRDETLGEMENPMFAMQHVP